MTRVPFLIARHPRHAVVVGKALLLAGGILVLAAVFARIGLANLNAERAGAKLPPVRRLAEAFPQYPTWFVPETVTGFGIAAFLVVAGVTLAVLGEKAKKGA